MSGGSLDILEGRVKSAVKETNILRAENARLNALLQEVANERDMLRKGGRVSGSRARLSKLDIDLTAARKRLHVLLGRIDRLEKHLNAKER